MKTLYCVTGATGHLGNNIVRRLVAQGQHVRALILNGQPDFMLDSSVERVYGDTTDVQSLEDFFKHNEDEEIVVIHTAAIVCITQKYDGKVYNVNVNGTKNIVDMCIKYHAKKLVHVGSVHAIDTQPNVVVKDCENFYPDKVKGNYAKSKAMALNYVLEKARAGLIDATVLLPSGIIGVHDYSHNHLMEMIKSFIRGKLPIAVKGEYDFVDVEDVVDATLSAVDKGKCGECYLVTNKNYTIKQLLDYVSECLNIKKIKTLLPIGFVKMFAPMCELHYRRLKKTPLFTSYSLSVLQSHDVFSHEKTTEQLDYNPRPLQYTVNNVVQWLLDCGIEIGKNMALKKRKVTKKVHQH